ncbi:glycosyltransferase [Pseudomonas japonica]|uniref:glycosyltransferase n=1 Tax=Pseudomonas japonica TaxID=256466 RepID=UPI0015E2A003|nr:glycosyltransferase [Pseudomonas japonica]MBA1243081.1 glycosyltransferase [Pseudomonas japonica]
MTQSPERRVLQFCHGYDGPFLDCARQYARLFAGRGFAVTTVFLTGRADPQVAAGCESSEVLFMGLSSRDVRGLKLGAIRQLRAIAASRNFEFCIAHRFKPIYVALLATALPVLGVHHAFGDYQRRGRRLFAQIFKQRLALLGVSDAVRDDIRRCLPGWPADRIQTLYNRVDVSAREQALMSASQAREALGLPAQGWIVGNAGRLHPDKDQATLLRGFAQALPRLPEHARLVIMGEGRLEVPLKQLAVELGIADRVTFSGQVPGASRYFRAFDVFVLSSDHEPFGMVLLEAMVAGVPVVATACGGAREVVEGAGLLFPLGHAAALADCLAEVASYGDECRAALVTAMAEQVKARFSDESVSKLFWQLPAVAWLSAQA